MELKVTRKTNYFVRACFLKNISIGKFNFSQRYIILRYITFLSFTSWEGEGGGLIKQISQTIYSLTISSFTAAACPHQINHEILTMISTQQFSLIEILRKHGLHFLLGQFSKLIFVKIMLLPDGSEQQVIYEQFMNFL